MQYEIKYRYKDVLCTYYMSLIAENKLLKQDVYYSARMVVSKYLGSNNFDIISVDKLPE